MLLLSPRDYITEQQALDYCTGNILYKTVHVSATSPESQSITLTVAETNALVFTAVG